MSRVLYNIGESNEIMPRRDVKNNSIASVDYLVVSYSKIKPTRNISVICFSLHKPLNGTIANVSLFILFLLSLSTHRAVCWKVITDKNQLKICF